LYVKKKNLLKLFSNDIFAHVLRILTMQNKRIDAVHPDYQAFLNGIIQRNDLEEPEAINVAIKEATRLTGVAIYHANNFSFEEIFVTLCALIEKTLNRTPDQEGCMPSAVKHLVVGHACGAGSNWTFEGGGRVNDYVNQHVSRGESVWVIACETGCERRLDKLEGREMISQGPQAKTVYASHFHHS
jgi:hypothetical protein